MIRPPPTPTRGLVRQQRLQPGPFLVGQPGSYTDVDHADVIALFGHNVAETQTVLWMRMLDRLAGSNPPRIMCVDPRRHQGCPRRRQRPCTCPAAGHERGADERAAARDHRQRLGRPGYVDAHTVGFDDR